MKKTKNAKDTAKPTEEDLLIKIFGTSWEGLRSKPAPKSGLPYPHHLDTLCDAWRKIRDVIMDLRNSSVELSSMTYVSGEVVHTPLPGDLEVLIHRVSRAKIELDLVTAALAEAKQEILKKALDDAMMRRQKLEAAEKANAVVRSGLLKRR